MKVISFRYLGNLEPELQGVRAGVVLAPDSLDAKVLDCTDWIAALTISEEVQGHQLQAGITAAASGVLRWLQSGTAGFEELAAHLARTLAARPLETSRYPSLGDVKLYAPLPRPGKVIGVGRNYADHAKETGVNPFEKPRIIFKMTSAIAAPGDPVPRPPRVSKMDYESELAVVIGRYAKNVNRENALDYVAGYTVLNDVSAREFQFDINPAQTTFAKSMDAFCPMGPWMVTKDEVPNPQALEVFCWVNGEERQHGHTSDMLFPVDYLVAYLSEFITLEPGDIITTGTPAGIGAFRKPPVYLQAGDRVRLEVTQVGAMEHEISE